MNAINVEEGLNRVVNNVTIYKRLLKNFSGRKLVSEIIDNVNNNDFSAAATSCHALKGVAANLAMHPLADVTARIEKTLKASQNPSSLLDELQESITQVESAIEEITAE